MRNAASFLLLTLSAVALAACDKAKSQHNQDINIDENMASAGLPPNTEVETLPADESSTTPSNQLQNGFDNPDVNSLGNGH